VVQVDVLFASVPVANLDRARTWYERFFGRRPDITPNETEEMWKTAEGAWLYVVTDTARAGHTLVSLAVVDLDEAIGELANRGLAVDSVETVGTAGRKARLRDPDENSVVLIEVRAPGRLSWYGGSDGWPD
jgi:hypothetical protein